MPDTLQALNAQRNYLESILQDLHGLTYGNGLVGFLLIQEVVLDDKNVFPKGISLYSVFESNTTL